MKFEITSNIKPCSQEMNYCLPCFYEPKFNYLEQFEPESDSCRNQLIDTEFKMDLDSQCSFLNHSHDEDNLIEQCKLRKRSFMRRLDFENEELNSDLKGMKKCWKRLKCDEDEEIYPNNSDNGYQNGEDLLSVPFYFKKEINCSIDKAVESRNLTTKISTNEDYDSMAYSLGSDMVECKLDGFEIKNGLDKMREQFCNDISSCISHQKFDAKSKFDMKEEHDESRSKTKITTDEFDFESVFGQLLVQPDSKLLIVNDISNLNSKTNLNSTNVLMNNTMNDPKFKSKFTFLNEFQQSLSYEEKSKCLNELITLVSSCDQSSDSKNLKNILDSLQNNSPYICNSLHFINQSKLTENEIL